MYAIRSYYADIEIMDSGVPASQIKKGVIARSAQNFYFFADMATKITGESFLKDGEFMNYTILV